MAFSVQSSGVYSWWLANRNGDGTGVQAGTALVSDLVQGDYLCGQRGTITAPPSGSGSNPRTLTLSRAGVTWTVTWPASVTVAVIR